MEQREDGGGGGQETDQSEEETALQRGKEGRQEKTDLSDRCHRYLPPLGLLQIS